jgi:hypothetical protein
MAVGALNGTAVNRGGAVSWNLKLIGIAGDERPLNRSDALLSPGIESSLPCDR